MSTRQNVAPDDRRRRRMIGGGVVLVLLAAVAVLLPMLLLSVGQPEQRPPGWPRAGGAAGGRSGSATPAGEDYGPTTEAGAASEYGETESAAVAEASTSPDAETAEGTLPIRERRRVQGGPLPPAPSTQPGPPPATRPDEWDRSPEARQRGVERFGGTPLTEGAVEAGLAWLAAHQSPSGVWDRFHFNRRCPDDDQCPGVAIERTNNSLDAGVTGLALLAFLGAGATDQQGPYQQVVSSAVDALLKLQQRHGGFSRDDGMAGYNDTLATLALAEYFALTGNAQVREPLVRAVTRLVRSQQPLGGWDYVPTPSSGRDDTSITAWAVQALHACAAAGVDVPPHTLVRAALHFARAAQPDGRVRYSDTGTGFKLDNNLHPVYRFGPAMTAAGLTCEQLLGWRLDGPVPLRQRGLLLAELPSADKMMKHDPQYVRGEYYWYYGTLAMFQRGGTDWERWNTKLRDAILPLQNREKTRGGHKSHAFGSWPPFGPKWGLWGKMGSRVYSTALCTLTLEIYYRHTPAYLSEEVRFTAEDWRSYLEGLVPRGRHEVVACLSRLRVEIAEPVLVDRLADEDRRVALAAAEVLADFDSPLGVPLIDAVITTIAPWERESLEKALERGKAVAALPPAEGRVRLYDPATRRATLDLPRSYVGMSVAILRAGQPIAHLRVIQRFTGQTVVVAELLKDGGPFEPEAGDTAVGR